MFENFSVSRRCSLLAQPEPPFELAPIPIPVFRPAVPTEDHGPAPVEVAILQELAEIKREVRALRAQSSTQNASAVSQARASEMLGCKRSQVFNLLAQGRLERAPKVGRSVMITVASIEALLAEGTPRKDNSRLTKTRASLVSKKRGTQTRNCEGSKSMHALESAIREIAV
ncbi:helix-turn-helix domain-containing protein [Myxococcus sp. NMCA1]|uniref:helix-turn-helix domain-containing protein n=1 Tax=Myxococcus sp. NMCA1 TaxID=2996785 RepID=UPI0022854C08|nr:helix-turn-helix domain-containing protein [Myxococcus sp. NMCA1]WAM23477.1 helix-turn-helix domain-containing protein [Myxococcus sp. NMCA1]